MKVFKIRQAQEEDLPQIRTLFRETIETVCIADYGDDQIRIWRDGANHVTRWQKRVLEQYFIVACTDNKIVGFASLAKSGYLDLMYVHKDWQGKGIASALFYDLLMHAEKNQMMKIWSDVSITAKPFFSRKGFRILHPRVMIREGIEIQNFEMELVLDPEQRPL